MSTGTVNSDLIIACFDDFVKQLDGKRELAEWQRVQLEELLSYRFKEFLGDRLREANIARFAFIGESLRCNRK